MAAVEQSPEQPTSMMLDGKIASKPIAVFYARDMTPQRTMEYFRRLTEQLHLGNSIVQDMDQQFASERLANIDSQVMAPMYGTALYMVSGVIPSFESVSFQQVKDEADARRLIDGRKNQWKLLGDEATVEDLSNGCYRVQSRSQSSYELPRGADESQYTTQTNPGDPGYQFMQKISEKDGRKMVVSIRFLTSFFRYQDTILYEAAFEDLLTMELPATNELRSAMGEEAAYGFKAHMDRIPPGIRQLGWTMLSSAAGSQLQQQDQESDASYNMRRSAGDAGLALIHSALFDLNSAEGSGTFASAEDDSLRGQLRILARNNSELSGQLTRSHGASRFAPILSDEAAATLHFCIRLPEEAVPALQNTATWIVETARNEHPSEPAFLSAAQALAGVLNGLSEHRTVEAFVKAGWTEGSAGVLYGGIHLSDTPELLQNVFAAAKLQGIAGDNRPNLELQERDDIQTLVFQLSEAESEQVRSETGMNITHVYLTHENSCLWIAAGTESAFDILRQSTIRCSENGGAIFTPLVSGRIDMRKWLSYPQDDPAHIAQLPYWLDENSWSFPPSPAMFFGSSLAGTKPSPIMQKVFDYGGSQEAYFALEADAGGLLLTTSLGEALANHVVARTIAAQEKERHSGMIESPRDAASSDQDIDTKLPE